MQLPDDTTAARQQIADELATLTVHSIAVYREAEAEVARQRNALRDRCGQLGHIWGRSALSVIDGKRRVCQICNALEPDRAAA